MNKTQVLAIGSPFNFDRIGWMVAKAISYHKSLPAIEIKLLDRPGIQLLNFFNSSSTLIIDAVCTHEKFGSIVEFPVNASTIMTIKKSQARIYSSHSIGLAQSLELALALDQLPENVYFLGFNINNEEKTTVSLKHFREFKHCILSRLIADSNRA